MMNHTLDNILPFARLLWARCLQEGATAVDATAGNGHDTVSLAQLVGETGRVYAFDVQAEALAATEACLRDAGLAQRVRLLHQGHQHLAACVPAPVDVVAFNCGYLPGGDKARTTQTATTLAAMQQALRVLRRGGVLTAVLYPGHAEGAQEAAAVAAWAATLNQQQFAALHYGFTNRQNRPPFLLAVEKLYRESH